MTDCVRITQCRLCDSPDLDLIVSFTPTPPGDQYLREPKPQTCYPLDLASCRACGAVQLMDTVDPALIYSEYIYTTSISKGLDAHFAAYADSVWKRLTPWQNRPFVIDIGSNDGTLLRQFQAKGCRVMGIDPAKAIAEKATADGIFTECAFFSADVADWVLSAYGQAHIITANHVFANVADLHDFTKGVKRLLAPGGMFVFETGYWPAIRDRMLIDTIEHEHIHYFEVGPLDHFFERHGLTLVAVEEQPTKGGSLRGYVRHQGQPRLDDSVRTLVSAESKLLHSDDSWAADVEALTQQVRALSFSEEYGCTMGYGAAVGSTLLLHHFGLGAKLCSLIDDNPQRQGLFSPGFHLHVNHPDAAKEVAPSKIVILAWRYAEMIMAAHPEHAGKWIIPLPTLRFA